MCRLGGLKNWEEVIFNLVFTFVCHIWLNFLPLLFLKCFLFPMVPGLHVPCGTQASFSLQNSGLQGSPLRRIMIIIQNVSLLLSEVCISSIILTTVQERCLKSSCSAVFSWSRSCLDLKKIKMWFSYCLQRQELRMCAWKAHPLLLYLYE